jgi:hypothetical protein
MSRNGFSTGFSAIIALLFFASLQTAAAQTQQGTMSGSKNDTMSQQGMMVPQQQMVEVRNNCQKSNKSASAALSAIRAAKSSDDPKEMRDALTRAEKELAAIQSHMTSALKKMNTLQSGSGSMQGGSQMEQQQRNRDEIPTMGMDSTKNMK